ncbi:MAG: OmpH family outer membrane protein [Pseudomonadota bacterium]|nr:OmpH family outer membrane protein [Pseudomonadota bacterium]
MRWLIAVMTVMFVNMAAAEQTKVAVVDMERALFLSDAAKVAAQKFEGENKDDLSKLTDLKGKLQGLQEKMSKDADVMSEDEVRKLKNDFEQASTEYKFYSNKLQKADQQWKREFFQTQLPNLEELLKAIIDEGGYDVVLQAGAVVYSSPKADLTKLLLERLNAK